MRLVFMGTPDFSATILEKLAAAGHDIVAVYSQPPRPAGRGKKLQPSPVHKLADQLGFPVYCPARLSGPGEQAAFAAHQSDMAVVVAYGLLLPPAILAMPRYGCLNIHASLLPRWRGAAPVQRAIMAGDTESGVDIMVMEAGLDTGPVLMERKIAIAPTDTAGVLHDRLKTLAAEMIVPALAGYAAGELLPRPQSDKGVCYAHKIDKAEARIDWTKPADYLQYHIHGLSPFPGAYSMLPTADAAPLRVKFLNVAPAAGQAGAPPGTVIGVPLTIACGAGSALRVLKAQRAGRAPMAAETLVRGLDLSPGTFFS